MLLLLLDVLDCGVLREEFAGEIVIGDGRVVWREVIALEAERADPDLGNEVDDGEGVEDGAASTASERGVREECEVWEGFDRSVDGGDRDYAVDCFLLCSRDHVPCHSDSVLGF